jgi:hypothetical protein
MNTLMLLYWYHRRRRNRNKRKYWVHPIVKQRFYEGTLTALNVCPYRYPMFCPIKQAFLQLNLSKSRDWYCHVVLGTYHMHTTSLHAMHKHMTDDSAVQPEVALPRTRIRGKNRIVWTLLCVAISYLPIRKFYWQDRTSQTTESIFLP